MATSTCTDATSAARNRKGCKPAATQARVHGVAVAMGRAAGCPPPPTLPVDAGRRLAHENRLDTLPRRKGSLQGAMHGTAGQGRSGQGKGWPAAHSTTTCSSWHVACMCVGGCCECGLAPAFAPAGCTRRLRPALPCPAPLPWYSLAELLKRRLLAASHVPMPLAPHKFIPAAGKRKRMRTRAGSGRGQG